MTIQQAIERALVLHKQLGQKAVVFDEAYLQEKLKTAQEGCNGRKFPLVDAVLCKDGQILVDCGWNTFWNHLQWDYSLTTLSNGLLLQARGRGFDPGGDYLLEGDTLHKASTVTTRSVPTVNSDGHFAWSTPREVLDTTNRIQLTAPDTRLLAMLDDMATFI